MPRRTVIFGGAGFLGLNLAEALGARQFDVTLFDLSPPPAGAFEGIQVVVGDVRDRAAVAAAIEPGTDAVIWGAAITADAMRDAAEPETLLEVNLAALVPVLRHARDCGVRRLINLSSVAAYGESAYGAAALCEDAPAPDPRSLYAVSKFATERVCMRLGELWSMDTVSVRLSAAFGPWERPTGSRDTPSPFMQLMRLAERGEEARLPGAGVCDWLYAPDAALAVLALVDAPQLAHRIYNVGPGAMFPVSEWGAHLAGLRPGFHCRIAGPEETPNVDLHRTRERAPLSIARLARECGFAPGYDLARSVGHLDAWARAHPGWFGGAA